MLRQTYNWQRYWRPRGARIRFSEDGFLYGPGQYNPHILPFEKIADSRCLVLLGEPGIGKSTAMKAEEDAVDERILAEGGQVLRVDLRSYGSEDRLVRRLFENDIFRAWVGGERDLHLFLDSLDECLLEIKKLSSLLVDELKNHPVERLVLRVACRTEDWPPGLEDGLKELWGEESVNVYELAHLTREDARAAASAEGIDADHFMSEVAARGVGPLAAKPVTLRLLLNLYQKGGGRLPSSQTELYARGCRLLGQETSQNYIDAGQIGRLTAAERMAVAARIAAVTIFGQKSAVWTAADFGNIPEEDVKIEELCGGVDIGGRGHFDVDAPAIEETINTGLFSSRGENRIGWAHQTYGEFLAAWHLFKLQMPVEQVLQLIVHAEDAGGKLVPQLHETAAWLAGMMPDVFHEIMRREPKVLLRSDIASANPESRAALVEELLKLYDEGREFDHDELGGHRYRKLGHPNIATQLRPYVKDPGKSVTARRAALDMAHATKAGALQDDLVTLALNEHEPLTLRFYAAHALLNAGDSDAKAKLRPLAEGRAGADPDNDLRAMGLKAVWPGHLLASELFPLLIAPKANQTGLYASFLAHEVVEGLKITDLPVALRWVEGQRAHRELNYYVRKLVDGIMMLGWENLCEPSVREAFASAALSRLQLHDAIVDERWGATGFTERVSVDGEKRRLFLETIVPLIDRPEQAGSLLVYTGTQMTWASDVPWMIERLRAASTEEVQIAWAALIKVSCDRNSPEQMAQIYTECQTNEILRDTFAWEFQQGLFDSSGAWRPTVAEAGRTEGPADQEPERTMPNPPMDVRILTRLEEVESGDLDAWWQLNRELLFAQDGTSDLQEEEPNLKILPGWERADRSTRLWITAAAKKYLLERGASPEKWLGEDTVDIDRPAYAGYRAFRLLLDDDPRAAPS